MPRQFTDENNKVSSTVADAWTTAGSAQGHGILRLEAVYWDGASGSDLKIRDAYGNEIYHFVSEGAAIIDQLASPLTVKLPLQYYTDEADTEIVIHGLIPTGVTGYTP